jgi:hypothetical protein
MPEFGWQKVVREHLFSTHMRAHTHTGVLQGYVNCNARREKLQIKTETVTFRI